jgi:hypothetical protein
MEEDAATLKLGQDFEGYALKGMMLAEVKLVLDSKLAGDRDKGEETTTTKTKCARARSAARARSLLPPACLRRRTPT